MGNLGDIAKVTWVFLRFIDNNRLAMRDDPPCDAPFYRDDQTAHQGFVQVGGALEIKLSFALVIEQDGGRLGVAQICRGLGNPVQEDIQVNSGGQIAGDFNQALISFKQRKRHPIKH